METAMINKKMVRKNKSLKAAGKSAKCYYGRCKGVAPKTKIKKLIDLETMKYVTLCENEDRADYGSVVLPDANELLTMVEKEGLTGLSGNGFAVVKKLSTFHKSMAKASDTVLIVNAVECDPALCHDTWLAEHELKAVCKGIEILSNAFGTKKNYIVSKKNLDEAVKICVGNVATSIQTVQLPDRYPMGYENEIIRSVLGITYGKRDIPSEHGILVMNLQTVMTIADIVAGKKVDARYLTAADLTIGKGVVVKAPLGMPVLEVAKQVFGETSFRQDTDNVKRSNLETGKPVCYTGGGALHAHVAVENELVTLQTNLIALGEKPSFYVAGMDTDNPFAMEPSKCKGCGGCTKKCPMGVQVHKLVQAIEGGANTDLSQYNPSACISCAACTYSCIGGKNVQLYVAKANGIL